MNKSDLGKYGIKFNILGVIVAVKGVFTLLLMFNIIFCVILFCYNFEFTSIRDLRLISFELNAAALYLILKCSEGSFNIAPVIATFV